MTDKLYFYSKSANKPPGKGKNEIVTDPSTYVNLPSNFRQILSNFHVAPFKYEGLTFNSIEHVFQAKKIALKDIKLAYRFTIESGDPIGLGDGAMAQKHRKLVVLNKDELECWDLLKDTVMFEAAFAKYSQNPDAASVLKATQDAQLWHIVMRKSPVRFKHLEEIRSKI